MSTGLRAFGDLRLSYDMREAVAPPPGHGKVMKADATADSAYALFDLPSDQSEVWVTFWLRFDTTALAVYVSSGSGLFTGLFDVTDGFTLNQVEVHDDSGPKWGTNIDFGTEGGTPVADAWQLVELHHTNGGPSRLYVDSTLLITGTGDSSADVRKLRFGQYGGANANNICYFDDVRIGTTRLGTDLFEDTFEDGTLDAWTSTSGTVSVIDDPF